MIKAFFLVFDPGATWDKIAQARRGYFFISLTNLLPLILLGSAVDYWGLLTHGKWQPAFEMYKRFTPQAVLHFEITQTVLLVAMVLVSTVLVYKIGRTLQDRLGFLQVFTTVAYGFGPMFVVRCLDAGATINPAVPWLLGTFLTAWVLYQGIPRVMQPDPTHAFGSYLAALIVVTLTSGLARLVTAMYLLGYMDYQHSWLSHALKHLFGP